MEQRTEQASKAAFGLLFIYLNDSFWKTIGDTVSSSSTFI